jgi:enterochelin esterase-like enzyme
MAISQVPTDNPYKTRYKLNEHWTDSFKWSNVINAADVDSLFNEKKEVNEEIFQNTMKRMSAEGGGVLYFGPGEYFFGFNIKLYNGCVIRGATPKGVADATNAQYRPPTKFKFPKFVMDFHGIKLPDNVAFKRITSDTNASFAIVNLDVNRGIIYVYGQSRSEQMVFGVRSNNATEHKNIYLPTSLGLGWLRYPNTIVGNIYTTFKRGVVANCRVNDSITDDFEIPNFMTNEGRVFKDTIIKFQYGLSSGITVNSWNNKPGQLELLDNYVKGYYACTIGDNFIGDKVIKNNQFIFLPCQDLIDGYEYYSKEILAHTLQKFKKEIFVSKTNDSLEYWLLSPKNYDPKKKYPLTMFFHGGGQHGSNKNPLVHYVFIYSSEEAMDNYPCFVLVPHIKKGEQFFSDLNAAPSRAYTLSIDLFKKIEEKYNIDTSNTFIAGVSTGGMGAIEATVRDPDLFHHAVIMSAVAAPLNAEQMNKIKNIHFIFSVGTDGADNENIAAYYRKAVSALRNQGNNVDYFEYPSGHWSWLNLCVDKKFLKLVLKPM